MGKRLTKRIEMTSEKLLEEAKLILQNYPDHGKIRDPLDGRKMLTKQEALNRFDGDDGWASEFAARYVGGLHIDQKMRKDKRG